MAKNRSLYNAVEVGWLCIIQCEFDAALALLDERFEDEASEGGEQYILGRVDCHNVVVAFPPAGSTGIAPTVRVAMKLQRDFRNLRFCLVVGVAGGCPNPDDAEADIRLGDVVVSRPGRGRGGVVQIDMGKNTDSGFKIFSHLNKANEELLLALPLIQRNHLGERNMDSFLDAVAEKSETQRELRPFAFPGQDRDRLFQSGYPHPSGQPTCANCDKNHAVERRHRERRSKVFYGTIGSANYVLRSARERDRLHREENILCVEMEAAGIMDTLPSLIIRGICDYADSHKNKEWQPYAALAAAAYAKDLLMHVKKARPARVHGDHCFIGSLRVDDVDRALARNLSSFRGDVAELAVQMTNRDLDFVDGRMPLFHKFLEKHGLLYTNKHWVGNSEDQVFDGYNLSRAARGRNDPQKDARERLKAFRAYAFIKSNYGVHTTAYLTADTVLGLLKYVED